MNLRGPLIGLCLCYVFGILAGTISDFPLIFLFPVLITIFIACGFLLFRKKLVLSSLYRSFPFCRGDIYDARGCGFDKSNPYKVCTEGVLSSIFLYLCLFLLGVVVIQYHKERTSHIMDVLSAEKGRKLSLKGTVVSEPEPDSFTLRVEMVEDKRLPASGMVLVRLNSVDTDCRYGDSIEIKNVYLSQPLPPRNPEQFDYRSFLLRRKIYALINVFSQKQITILGTGRVNPVTRLALILKRRMETIIRRTMVPSPQRFFLESILLGNRYLLPAEMKEIFANTGTAHLISISGLHVGFVLAIFLLLFKILNVPLRTASLLTIVIIVIYCLLTGSRPPAVRASIMAIMILTGTILNRPVDIWNSLFTAAFIILIMNPAGLFDMGFQMSFMAVAGIICIHSRLEKLWVPSQSWLRWGWKTMSVIIAAQIFVLPLVIYYFNTFPLVTFPANFIVVPILGMVVGLGFSTCLSGVIWIGFAHLFNSANWVVITVLLKILDFFKNIPGSCIYVSSPPVYVIFVYYLGVFILLKMLDMSSVT